MDGQETRREGGGGLLCGSMLFGTEDEQGRLGPRIAEASDGVPLFALELVREAILASMGPPPQSRGNMG